VHLWLAVARRKLEIRQFCCKFVGVCRGNPQIRSFFAARCIAFGQQPSQFGRTTGWASWVTVAMARNGAPSGSWIWGHTPPQNSPFEYFHSSIGGVWSVQNPFPALCRYNALTSSSCPALATVRHQGRAAAWPRVWDGMLPDFHSPLWVGLRGFYDELLELLSNIARGHIKLQKKLKFTCLITIWWRPRFPMKFDGTIWLFNIAMENHNF